MGIDLHQILRSLCYNTDWKYAVFWKLKHRARMVLTWEDAYYENGGNYDLSGNKCFRKNLEHFDGGHLSHDPLGLAVAKMSYHVYSLGEGIVGQVAVTGKHQWICVDNHVTGSGSSFESSVGWQSQLAAGIRTIAVVAVSPLGVIQLGSLNKVIEDVEVVNHIRGFILGLQGYSLAYTPTPVQCSMKNSSCQVDSSDICSPFSCSGKSCCDVHQKKAIDVVVGPRGSELYCDEFSILPQASPNTINLEHKKHEGMRLLNERKCADENSGCKNMGVGSEGNATSLLHSSVIDSSNLNDLKFSGQNIGVGSAFFPSDFLEVSDSDKLCSVEDFNPKGVPDVPRPSDIKFRKDMEKLEFQTQSCYRNTSYTLLNFPAGCELHEALGPAFLKKSSYFDYEEEKQDVKTLEMPERINNSQLTSESHPEDLLEAIVGSVFHSNNDVHSEVSLCTSVLSPLASGKKLESSIHTIHTINSEGCSIDQSSLTREDKQPCLSLSGISDVMSPKGFSSCPGTCSEPLERSSESAKNKKKRVRPGESCRPRPRDRQLIQDRIKELRELVPNGAKCSIDSLLEHAAKHMLFMQSISKHVDKLNTCTHSKIKLHHSGADINGSSNYEQGSSWAMEVGGHLKVHSILVENLNKNGQMLVEMLCDECSHFLEIAEAIRSLGLTILKGATEAHGEKTWICFVVEGQNSRIIHRLDILWPLVQILQSKSTMYSQ
ncbi:Transcription factor [Quillaja saponaria]|uniref:Transcription factor n=1 Tax=Quillaja saponaria TaxID=32244 RepID=A0AAD7Q0N0_QUISA|nr:Transcription factor [Quillaja saponaria]